jgi:hypothetical protein
MGVTGLTRVLYMRRELFVSLFCLSAGCSSMTESSQTPSVRAEAATLTAVVRGGRLEFTVPLVITNGTAELIQYEPCGAVLERNVQGLWRQVWGARCTLETTAMVKLQPGATLRSEVAVTESVSYIGSENWPGNSVDGEYRMRVLLVRPGERPFKPDVNTSNTFTVRAEG